MSARILTVETSSDVVATVKSPLTHVCPFADEIDEGSVAIEWRCAGCTIELHSLRAWLDAFRESRLSHEELTDLIRHELSTLPGIDLLSVATTWHTAGMGVQCATTPTPRATERGQR